MSDKDASDGSNDLAEQGHVSRLQELVKGLNVGKDDVLTEIIVIAKTSNMTNGLVGLCYNYDSKDWVLRRGMLHGALEFEQASELVIGEEERHDD